MNDSIDSCAKSQLDPIQFIGTFDSDIDFKLKEYNLSVSPLVPKMRRGELGCFISHYELWKQCAELNCPILILEHDVEMKMPLPSNLQFNELLNLDYCSTLRKDIEKYKKCMVSADSNVSIEPIFPNVKLPAITWKSAKTYHVVGAHAYCINPVGAKKLISATHTYGIMPADVHINLHYVNIEITKPSIFRTCDYMLNTRNRVKHSSTKKG